MSNLPVELRYSSSHEWVRAEGNNEYSVGITDHAQQLLGDMVFVDLPDIGDVVTSGDECAVVESVKAASDIYAPVSGEIIAINENLEATPELVNSDPYDEGWLFRIRTTDDTEFRDLLEAADYQATIEEEEE